MSGPAPKPEKTESVSPFHLTQMHGIGMTQVQKSLGPLGI